VGGRPLTSSLEQPLRSRGFVAALATALVVALGFGLIVPVLPLFARAFGVGLFAVTLLVSVFAAVRLVFNVYTGTVADRIGTRHAIAWGATVVAVSSLACAAAPGYWWLVAARGAGGFGSALFINALLAHVLRSVPASHRGRAMGLLQGAFLLGIAFGPSVGGVLAAPLGLRWPFVIYAGFCMAAGGVALTLLPPAPAPRPAEHVEGAEGAEGEPVLAATATDRGLVRTWRATRELCADPAFLAALVMMAASRWAVTGVRFSLVPVFAEEEIGMTLAVLGFALTLAALTHLAVVWPAGKLADTFGRRALAAPAFLAYAAVVAVLAFVGTVPAFLAVMALFGIGTGLTAVTPPAVVGDVVSGARTGMAVGVLNTAGDLGSVLGPPVSGLLADVAGYGWGFGAAAAMLVVGALFALRMRETLPARATSPPIA
jgi:MFS transporter, DHA1 family, multidrug resistance protein